MVPIASRPALASLPSGGSGTLGNFLGRLGTDCVMLYAPDEHDGRVAHCRMFAPALGVAEDVPIYVADEVLAQTQTDADMDLDDLEDDDEIELDWE